MTGPYITRPPISNTPPPYKLAKNSEEKIMWNENEPSKYNEEYADRGRPVLNESTSQISLALISQEKIIENLSQELYLLQEQLAPVLLPRDKEPSTKAQAHDQPYPDSLCPIADRLYEHSTVLERITRDLVSTRKSLGV